MNSTRVLLALAALAAAPLLSAADRFVTSGKDYDVNDPPIPNTLRFEIAQAQPGDTIYIARNLIVHTFDRITIPPGKDNLTITGPEEGSAQIRAIIERGENSQNNALTVLSNHVVFRKLTFRDLALRIGDFDEVITVQGGTVIDCEFTQRGNLRFLAMNNGLAQRCTMKVAKYEIGAGAIEVVGGDGTVVRDCKITLLRFHGDETALGANGGTNLLFENNVLSNGDLRFWAESGKVIDNALPNRVLDLTLADPVEGPGPYEFIGNECGALTIKARNFIVRDNIISGRVTGRRPAGYQIVGGDPLEKEAPVSLLLFALDGAQPVVVENNFVNGGTNGVVFELVGPGGAIFSGNTIRNVAKQGMILDAESPVQFDFNLFEKCGNTARAPFGSGPTPALHLRAINAAVTVKQNTFRNCRGTAIFAAHGSPVFDTNTITGGTAAGMMFQGAVTPVFAGVNRIELMGRCGVVARVGTNITVEGVVFDRNGICGLSVEPGAAVTSRNNTFTAQRGPGIKLATEFKTAAATFIARALVHGDTFTANKGAGVLVGKGGSCEIVGGAFTENTGPGIDLLPAGVTKNTRSKQANGDIDFPEQLTFDAATRMLRGKAEPGALVRMYRAEKNKRTGNPKNGEGALFVASAAATGDGDFALPPGPTAKGDMFTFTATRPAIGQSAAVTSEFSENIEVPPSPPVELISQSSNEEAGNGLSIVNDWNVGEAPQVLMINTSVSTDASFVLFHSAATNLVNDDTNNAPDLFLRDRAAGTTERVNVTSSGAQAGGNFAGQPARVGHGSLSADGRWVVFASESTNLVAGDVNSSTDIFLRDRQTGTTIAVTDPTEQPDMSVRSGGWDCSISADGQVVALVTRDSRFTGVGVNGEHRVLVWTRITGQFEEVNSPPAPAFFHHPRLSADGRFVVFFTRAKLVAADTDSRDDIYLRDRNTGTTERLSVATNGTAMGGGSPSISADGRFVAFASGSSGDAADTDGQPDIYVRDRQLGTTVWVSQPPAGLDPGFGRDCSFPSLSTDGRYVAYGALGSTTRPGEATVLVEDIFVRDRQLGVTIEANIGVLGDVRGGSSLPVLSPDGRQVVFGAEGVGFIPGDVQPLGEVFARTISPDDFEVP